MSADVRRVAVVGDCPLLRNGMAHVVEDADGLALALTTRSAHEAAAELARDDIALVDLQLPAACLAEVVAQLTARGIRVIVFSSGPGNHAVPAMRAGARGCLSRQADEHELLAAIRLVADGCSYISADLAVRPETKPSCHVTDRERQILELIAHGETDHDIAVRLGISEHTVHSHLDRLRDKIGSRRRADLTRFAITHDIIPAGSWQG
ncbi:LuxR C-terminal-related transcriptional regulator [Streptomyces cupreus]|uniref:Response regulator transcription factor n=1 Tax=Streptomyces cupreus TaxID=2759956 RepID=A0A7X1J2G0_9ACTN|nr:response regulator transcription factor [Streptomyces cupreus]MBC2902300.1 response regulator transcription factor [Streptomyces cupreus]